MKSVKLKSLSHPFDCYHEFFALLISSANLEFILYRINSPENKAPVNPPKRPLENI